MKIHYDTQGSRISFSGAEIDRVIDLAAAVTGLRIGWCSGDVDGLFLVRSPDSYTRVEKRISGRVVSAARWGYIRQFAVLQSDGRRRPRVVEVGGMNAIIELAAAASLSFRVNVEGEDDLGKALAKDEETAQGRLRRAELFGSDQDYLKALLNELVQVEDPSAKDVTSRSHTLHEIAIRLNHLPEIPADPALKGRVARKFFEAVKRSGGRDPILTMHFCEAMHFWRDMWKEQGWVSGRTDAADSLKKHFRDADVNVAIAALVSGLEYPDLRDDLWEALFALLDRVIRERSASGLPVAQTCLALCERAFGRGDDFKDQRLAAVTRLLARVYKQEWEEDGQGPQARLQGIGANVLPTFFASRKPHETKTGNALQETVYAALRVSGLLRALRMEDPQWTRERADVSGLVDMEALASSRSNDVELRGDETMAGSAAVRLIVECKDKSKSLDRVSRDEAQKLKDKVEYSSRNEHTPTIGLMVCKEGVELAAKQALLTWSDPPGRGRAFQARYGWLERGYVDKLLSNPAGFTSGLLWDLVHHGPGPQWMTLDG